jgi:hypothetical protein
MWVDEACSTSSFVNGHSSAFNLFSTDRMLAQIMDDFAHARQQPGILKNRLAYGDAIPFQLPSFPEQPGCIGQCSHGNRSVIGRHTSKLVAGHKNGSGAQLRSPLCSGQTSRTSANDCDIHQALPIMRVPVM